METEPDNDSAHAARGSGSQSADPITAACVDKGSFTLSEGTSAPAIVLARLLDALSVLSPPEHRRLTAPGGLQASIPPAALRDASSTWWSTNEASALLEGVIAAINSAAPEGYACCCSGPDRLELVPLAERQLVSESLAPEPSFPPSASTVRARVSVP